MTTPNPCCQAKEFSIAIVGGGIGGLALAIGLLQRKIQVEIYEAASKFSEVGLGLTIGPAAHRTMPLIDPQIYKAYNTLITTHADSPGYEKYIQTWFEFVWASGDKAGEVLMDLKASPSGQTSVRRADFLDALVNLVPKERAHFGKRLERLEETTDKVHLYFEDNTSAQADVVIGCDGIKSKVKDSILTPEETRNNKPYYSGIYGYRTVLDMKDMETIVGEHRARVATMYVGHGAYALTYPVLRAKRVNVGLYKLDSAGSWNDESWVRLANKEQMQKDMKNMGDSIAAIVEHLEDTSQWAIFERPPISQFCKSRIALLGDAAHASSPHQGAGAGQAIEDAHVLAELLADPRVRTSKHAVLAFQAYDAVRRPRAQKVVETSRENGELLCLSFHGIGDDERKLKDTWGERFKWLWDLDVVGQAEEARAHLTHLLSV